jgi:hypothetical protein
LDDEVFKAYSDALERAQVDAGAKSKEQSKKDRAIARSPRADSKNMPAAKGNLRDAAQEPKPKPAQTKPAPRPQAPAPAQTQPF